MKCVSKGVMKNRKLAQLLCAPHDHSQGEKRTPSVDELALEKAASLMMALGDVSRIRLVALLAQCEACVTELAAAENENLSTISQRLKLLRAEGLVVRRREGKHINYTLSDQHIVDLIFNALAHASEGGPERFLVAQSNKRRTSDEQRMSSPSRTHARAQDRMRSPRRRA
jgi:ArsR family transcriptional regulator